MRLNWWWMQLSIALSVTWMIGVSPSAQAGPREDAPSAYRRGDLETAIRLYRQMAEQGDAWAQSNLGYIYHEQNNYDEAAIWFRKAASQGYAPALNALGALYDHGRSVARNYVEAARWYREAVRQGEKFALKNLGALYANGNGVLQDNARAYMWLYLAAPKFSDDKVRAQEVEHSIQIVAARLTPAQITSARELAFKCQGSNYRQCGEPETGLAASLQPNITGSKTVVGMKKEGGVYVVPVQINNSLVLDFLVDSGASDVSIPADVVMTLMRTKTITKSDFLGKKTYILADGTEVPSETFRLHSLKAGDRTIENVVGSISSVNGALLLGQSFLSRFNSWSIDNTKHVLVLE